MSRTEPVIIGVDPGGRTTGLVATQGTQVLGEPVLIQRAGRINTHTITDCAYIAAVVSAVTAMHYDHVRGVVAVEGVNCPSPHMGMTNAAGVIATGVVLGAILGNYPAAILVPPAKHGGKPMAAYPDVLVGPRESAAGTGRLRHCRSAYDVALSARQTLRIERAS